MGQARKAALEALLRVERENAYSNLALSWAVKKYALDGRDASLAGALLYGVLEQKLLLDYVIGSYSKTPLKKLQPEVLGILRMGVYQLLFLDKVPDSAAVNESVKLAKYKKLFPASGFINGLLRAVSRAQVKYTLPGEKKDWLSYASIKYSCPKEIILLWQRAYGEETTRSLLKTLSGRPPITARVNTLLTSRDELARRLSREEGIEAAPVPFLQNALALTHTGAIESSQAFMDGLFTVQDLSSQLLCELLSPKPGSVLSDVCAAPGGKSMNCAMHMENRGEIYAYDLYEHKISLMEQAAKRLHIGIVKPSVRDALCDAPLVPSDYILCDVPCSGLGLLRRKPEIRYKKDLGLDTLPELQYRILENSSRYLKKGGTLFYSTCTLNPGENSGVVRRFLTGHPDFAPLPLSIPKGIRRGTGENENELTLFPHVNGTDGFFISAMKRM